MSNLQWAGFARRWLLGTDEFAGRRTSLYEGSCQRIED
jgi:hypothetical protein